MMNKNAVLSRMLGEQCQQRYCKSCKREREGERLVASQHRHQRQHSVEHYTQNTHTRTSLQTETQKVKSPLHTIVIVVPIRSKGDMTGCCQHAQFIIINQSDEQLLIFHDKNKHLAIEIHHDKQSVTTSKTPVIHKQQVLIICLVLLLVDNNESCSSTRRS